ncbi:thiamine biosynthesis protein ThiF [Corynebacterium suranareeae]|uniref:Thiamine biosynthesis protein ThiF n=1 Tax=Corynebacterium suranareeae TaxID=2506452 RepID=A0A160PRT1_9CORY|nr:ThiF family adenylyltransferase [Corynebacterium suranareeae]BAU96376.1 thiamine biosynthesis protein ThiF [Corynebacterium suranareeae]
MSQLPDIELHRTARQLALPGYGIEQQTILHNAHVLVIGAGGLGCPAMQSLASAGVGTITVIDDDTVDISNIHRQILFGASDVGQSKVSVAARCLKELQPSITVNALNQRITPENACALVASVDLVLDGSDSFSTKYLVSDAAEITGTPLIWATVLRFHGELALFHSGPNNRGVGLRDVFPEQPSADFVPDCATAGVLGATTATIGALMATHAIGFLTKIGDVQPGVLLSYDAFPATTRSFRVSADPARPLVTELRSSYEAARPETTTLIDATLNHLLTALDIREPHEVLLKDLPEGATSLKLPLSQINSEDDVVEALSGLDQDILVYCASGKRSADFITKYSHLGHRFINLPGGVNAL